jgi:hypothetical protein
MLKSGRMRLAGHAASMERERYAYRLLVRKPEGRWVMDFGEIRWSGVDWIGLAQDRDKWKALASGS